MRTTLNIDDEAMVSAMRLSPGKTKTGRTVAVLRMSAVLFLAAKGTDQEEPTGANPPHSTSKGESESER